MRQFSGSKAKAYQASHAKFDKAYSIRPTLLRAVRARHPDLVISIDTWRAEVGEAAVEAGADLLNDTWRDEDAKD